MEGHDTMDALVLPELVRGGGLRPMDVGQLRRARQLRQLGFVHLSLQDRFCKAATW